MLKDEKTLSAVFNDTITIGTASNSAYQILGAREPELWIWALNKDDLDFCYIDEGKGAIGTVIEIGPKKFREFCPQKTNYVRFRIYLRGGLKWLFSSEDMPADSVFISSFFRTRIVEFRINEKRNLGEALKRKYPERTDVRVDMLHYFLVRHIHVELSRSHANFKKMRRLEPQLWKGYLSEFGNVDVENMVIYHWREPYDSTKNSSEIPRDGVPSSVNDFIALCEFRELRGNVPVYLFAIVLLGAIGNSAQSGLTSYFSHLLPFTGLLLQSCLLGLFLSLLVLLFLLDRGARFLRSRAAYEIASGARSRVEVFGGIMRRSKVIRALQGKK